ncbi:MAG: DUF58 domain-containing protein [Thermoplasmata archaeon]|nr:DUF58 domain-containing protein [Thermoplasmata archaeon]MCI4359684.1 DUF58 domain-containing protein [Thermoplasmata archaeon]
MTDTSESAGPARLRPMSLGLLSAGVLFTAAAFVLRSPSLLFLAVPLLTAPVAALVSLPRNSSPLRLSWTEYGLGPEIHVDGTLEGTGAVASRSIAVEFTRPEPICEDRPPVLTVEDTGARFRITWRAPYPLLARVPVPSAILLDPLALVERDLRIVGTPLPIERFPPEAERIGAVRLRRTTALPGEVNSRAMGSSGEFFGIRFAEPGDSPRHVNWRATGRTGRQCVNEFLLDRTGDLLIVLDARPTALGSADDQALLSIGRAAAYGIARGFLKEKNRVGVAVFGEYLDAVPLGSGRTHAHRIEQILARAQISEETGPAERLAVSLRRVYPAGVSTLLITPLAEEGTAHVLPHLRRRGFSAFVLSPSPLRLHAGPSVEGAEDRAIERLAHLVRRARIGRVWEDAPVLDWEEYWSLGGLRGLLRLSRPSGIRR